MGAVGPIGGCRDEILSLNGVRSVELKMQQIRSVLQQRDGMKIEVALDREGKSFSTVLRLKSLSSRGVPTEPNK